MANAVTLTTMIARVRSVANFEYPSASGLVTDAEITQWLNDAIRELYDKLIRARGEDYYAVHSEQTMVVGQTDYDIVGVPPAEQTLPQLFYRMLEVVVDDGSHAVRIPRFQSGEYADMRDRALRSNASCPSAMQWRLTRTTRTDGETAVVADQVQFQPAPGTAWTLRCYYIPTFVDLGAAGDGTDSFDGINGWEEWAVLTAAVKCLAKEESDPSALLALRADLDARIARMADRDDSEPRRVADTNPDRFSYVVGIPRTG